MSLITDSLITEIQHTTACTPATAIFRPLGTLVVVPEFLYKRELQGHCNCKGRLRIKCTIFIGLYGFGVNSGA